MKRRIQTDHMQVAGNCRQQPGEWQHVRAVATDDYGRKEVWRIEGTYRLAAYEPAGAFEARTRQRDMDTAVEARWLGPDVEHRLRRTANTTDTTTTRTGGAS
ncbi:hypothetical protein K378_01371 [Streptomyces sp. Amel2xB2]|uniref:hypothetical protein n=1 Tax=Streptomyces sp. Amel2xB2 TaxID=1305829 RepID=UPI000DB995F9|nr:hypothetical protein [Streptomyces sp. Amel2xB2]RAJ70206.1 hypothetical protein K378_01371 [Streptomyces sp. Amel2xB2]